VSSYPQYHQKRKKKKEKGRKERKEEGFSSSLPQFLSSSQHMGISNSERTMILLPQNVLLEFF
jgi:hypothetical protein